MKYFLKINTIGKPFVAVVIMFIVGFGPALPAEAVSAGDWQAGRIIDDGIFYNKSSMDTDQIQQFLNSKVPVCDSWGAQPYAGTTRRAYSEARGVQFPLVCLKDYQENPSNHQSNLNGAAVPAGAKSAASIIWEVAQTYNINPQVLIVLLQKEQGLVTDTWPWPYQYKSATGYGCPDSNLCNSNYYGFYNQVTNAARQFRLYANSPNSYNFIPFQSNTIRFNSNASCGSSTVFIQNQATASLYNYTPYQPNQAALNNIYGQGDACSAYGNRNFWAYFNDWFGMSLGDGFALVKSDDPADLRQWVIYGSIKQYIPDSQTIFAWGLQNTELVTMSATALSRISTGPALDRLVRIPGGPIYFVDAGTRYRIPWETIYKPWNLQGVTVSTVSKGLFDVLSDGGDFNSFSVKDPNTSDVYMVDGRNSSGQTVLRRYANETVRFAIEGANAPYVNVSNDYWSKISSAMGEELTSSKVANNGKIYEVMNRFKFELPSTMSTMYPGVEQAVSDSSIERMASGGFMSYLIKGVSSPAVYAVDNGTLHHIQSPDMLHAWSLPGARVFVMNDNFIDLLGKGSDIQGYFADSGGQLYLIDTTKTRVPQSLDAAYRNVGSVYNASSQLIGLFSTNSNQLTGFIKSRTQPQVYLVDNNGKRRHIKSPGLAESWGAWRTGVVELSDSIVDSMGVAPSPSLYVSDGINDYVMDDGHKLPVDSATKANWGFSAPQTISDGTLDRFDAGDALGNTLRSVGGYFMVEQGRSYGTTDPYIAEAWNIQLAPQRSSALLGLVGNSMLTRFVRSPIAGDSRLFIIDKGVWYNLSSVHAANFHISSQPVMALDPSVGGTIKDWQSAIIRNPQGIYFVVDDGGRRYFPNTSVQDHWTNFGQLDVLMVTNGLILSLPDKGVIERAIKGGGPAVYSARNGQKLHILSPNTYNSQFGIYAQVSNSLLNALPDGNAIP